MTLRHAPASPSVVQSLCGLHGVRPGVKAEGSPGAGMGERSPESICRDAGKIWEWRGGSGSFRSADALSTVSVGVPPQSWASEPGELRRQAPHCWAAFPLLGCAGGGGHPARQSQSHLQVWVRHHRGPTTEASDHPLAPHLCFPQSHESWEPPFLHL